MRVECDVERVELEGDDPDRTVPSLCVTCTRCGHQADVYGQRGRSLRRGLVMLREECPRQEENYYHTDTEVDE